MPISTNIPLLLTPGVYIEIDNSRALGGLVLETHRMLVIGQKLTGDAAANVPVRVTSVPEAVRLFGAQSMLAHMFRAIKRADEYVETWALPLADDGAAVKATGKISFAGPATAAGVLALYIGGERIAVSIASGATAAQAATAVAAAIQAAPLKYVSAVVDGEDTHVVNLEALHGGVAYNSIDIRLNYNGEPGVPGLTPTITGMASGATNPSLTAGVAALGSTKWHTIVLPYTDTTSLGAIEAELATRWGPTVQLEGHAFAAHSAALGALLSLGNGRNSPHVSIAGMKGSPTAPFVVAAVLATVAARGAWTDPARPLQTLLLPGVLSPAMSDRFTRAERHQLLADGIATVAHDDDGLTRIDRCVTTYQTAPGGAADPSYRDVEVLRTLAFLRTDLRALIALRFPRHKLASNGTVFGAGQAVVTPDLIRDEIVARFALWERAGLVEGREQFETGLQVERDDSDTERVNALIPPDVINAFRVFAGSIQFRL